MRENGLNPDECAAVGGGANARPLNDGESVFRENGSDRAKDVGKIGVDLDKRGDGDQPRDPKTPPMPEPGTALLLGLGLMGLAGRSRANA